MVLDAASPDSSSPLPYQVYGNSKIGTEIPTKATYDQLLERQVLSIIQTHLMEWILLLSIRFKEFMSQTRNAILIRSNLIEVLYLETFI